MSQLASMKATRRRQKKSYENTKPFWRSHTATESQAKRRPQGWPTWCKWSKNPLRAMRRKPSHSRSWSLGRDRLSRSCFSVRWAQNMLGAPSTGLLGVWWSLAASGVRGWIYVLLLCIKIRTLAIPHLRYLQLLGVSVRNLLVTGTKPCLQQTQMPKK